ncbi:tRNA pseudouridine(38-40) synthase TruA [Aestuariimicrobium sp. p3-SID1156]|uniref:tRNA pseudouridine(38-40) synthase TruA n=1 Tax=Aestuariimicrobium sp. p3-SID1156 TaxID=2916038 RepID=UPI00223B18DE|nr:tRNA pseudouridine(38-40) synthase TruA [Aestuariimicrobium sp. p3-SID1156]MCT1460143.1 tRNA pseudouridine(38-40) synthase TruA [Aestuariimicrobium sp. p3-SID1156]
MRLRLDLAYDGTDFSGWATQPGLRTVQGELEGWITQVLRLPEPAQLVVAGRTDAGVHATGQVCHLDLPEGWRVPVRDGEREDVDALLGHRLRRVLPADVVVHAVRPVPTDFDARFSALWRRYTYRVWDERTHRDPTLRRRSATVRGSLDVDAMNSGAQVLLGLHDFAAFCKPRQGATTIRTLQRLEAVRNEAGEVVVMVVADAFCHSMVRSLMGALCAVGQGVPSRVRRDEEWLAALLRATGRDSSVLMMPASGLTLSEVGYPAEDQLAARAVQARRRRDEEPA